MNPELVARFEIGNSSRRTKGMTFCNDQDGMRLLATYLATLTKEVIEYRMVQNGSRITVEITGF
jgi:hypothetical protein